MTKAEDRRIRMGLERERLKLKEERLEIVNERRALRRERADALIWLRLLCERYGDNSWPDETPMALILEKYLSDPLGLKLGELLDSYRKLQRQVRDGAHQQAPGQAPEQAPAQPQRPSHAPPAALPAPQRATPHQQAPRPLRPTLVPEVRHSVMVVPFELRGERGHRAICTCSWKSALENTVEMALLSGQRHEQWQADHARRQEASR
jgi:hypothetical protein